MNEEKTDVVPVEPEVELANIIKDDIDPDIIVAVLERKAELANRMKAAQETIIATQTYPDDWHIFGTGDKARACLGSAGAERVARMFDIRDESVASKKETFSGGYRYIYEGYMIWKDRKVHSIGVYSSKDQLLGTRDGTKSARAIEDVDENDIQMAAYHVFRGNGIKALLGLRGLPVSEYNRIMNRTGQDAKKTGSHSYGKGTQGGATSTKEPEHQKELAELCIKYASACMFVEKDGKGYKLVAATDEQAIMDTIELAKLICIELSGFDGKDGRVTGKVASQLSGKWLNTTLNKARKLLEQLEGEKNGN